jgi:hypothetical protein
MRSHSDEKRRRANVRFRTNVITTFSGLPQSANCQPTAINAQARLPKSGHMWTAPWQELSDVAAGAVLLRHQPDPALPVVPICRN